MNIAYNISADCNRIWLNVFEFIYLLRKLRCLFSFIYVYSIQYKYYMRFPDELIHHPLVYLLFLSKSIRQSGNIARYIHSPLRFYCIADAETWIMCGLILAQKIFEHRTAHPNTKQKAFRAISSPPIVPQTSRHVPTHVRCEYWISHVCSLACFYLYVNMENSYLMMNNE